MKMNRIDFTEDILKEMGYATEIIDENNVVAYARCGARIVCTLIGDGTRVAVVNVDELEHHTEFPYADFFDVDNDRDGIVIAAIYAMQEWLYEGVE